MSMMQSALRITDRFYGTRDPESIERQGRLQNCIMLVFIFHMMMVVAFLKLQEFEVKHPRIIRDVDVNFEFTPPPPEPPPKPIEMPKALSLTEGANPNPGSEAAPTPMEANKAAMPALPVPATDQPPTNLPAKPVPSRKTTMAAPVAVTPTNLIKTPLGQQAPREAPVSPPTPVIAGNTSTQAPSGSANAGGVGTEGGVGTGGNGAGGGGTGQGDFGAGTGEGPAGGTQIATKLPSTLTRAMGNIGPYRKDLLLRLAQNWHPKKANTDVIVLLTIGHDGGLLNSEIFQSSGNKKIDKEALAAAQTTEYAPLPDWYKGEQLTFKIELSKVEAAQAQQ